MKIGLLLVALVVLLATGCAHRVTVNSDYREGTDFAQHKTYRWQAGASKNRASDALWSSSFVDDRLQTNIDKQLQSKGYRYQPEDAVDFLVSYQLYSEVREDIRSYGGYAYAGYPWYGWYPWWRYSAYHNYPFGYGAGLHDAPRLSVIHYNYAILVVSLVDAESGDLLWRSEAEGRLPDEQTAEERRETIERFVTKALADLPASGP